MKVLSVKEPWASLIVYGVKDIENRSWNTKLRGRILIHASKTSLGWNSLNNDQMEAFRKSDKFSVVTMYQGAIIGSVEIVDCVKNNSSIWADKGCYNWILKNPVLFKEPIGEVSGKLGLWNFDIKPFEYG